MNAVGWRRLGRAQRKVRQARLLLLAAQEEAPDLTAEIGNAITHALAAERRSSALLKEGIVR